MAAMLIGCVLFFAAAPVLADDPEITITHGAVPEGWETSQNAALGTTTLRRFGGDYRLSDKDGCWGSVDSTAQAYYGIYPEKAFRENVSYHAHGAPVAVGPGRVGPLDALQAKWAGQATVEGLFCSGPGIVAGVGYHIPLPNGKAVMLFGYASGPPGGADEVRSFAGTLAAYLETFRFQVKGQPAAPAPTLAPLPACNATLLLPGGLKPGDTLSPDARVTSADGKPVQGRIGTVWYINGRQTNSVRWDGTETRIALQLSCQGRAQEFNAVVPAYVAVNEGGGGPDAPLPPILVPAGVGAAAGGGLLGRPLPGMGSAGTVPGPRTLGEALVSVLVPAGVGALGAVISAVGQGVTAVTSAIPMTPVTPAVPAAPGQPGAAEGKKEEGEDRAEQREEDRRRTVTPAQLEALQRDFEEMVRQKRADGYWVKNDALLRSLWNSVRDNIPWSDPRGGRCGEFGEWGMEWSKEFVRKTFGDKAIIDDIVMQERSTLNPEGVADTIDSVVGTSNHRATRVILPNGDRYVLDFWEAVSTGKPRLQNEFEWIAHWRWKVSPLGTDAVVTRSDAEQALSRFVREYGEKQGSDMFRRATSNKGLADTVLRSWRKFPW